MDNSYSCKQKIITETLCNSKLCELLDSLQHELPDGFWGVVEVRFKDGKPVVVEEHRQIKLGDTQK